MNDRFRIQQFGSFAELPAQYAQLQAEEVHRHGLFREVEWFDLLMHRCFEDLDELRLYGVEDAATGRALLFVPLRRTALDAAVPDCRVIASVSHPENYSTAAFAFAAGLQPQDRVDVLVALFRHFKRGGPGLSAAPFDAVRLWPIELGSELDHAIHRALRAAGFWTQHYANSVNCFEDTQGVSYDAYLAQRSANLRYSIRRRQRALEKDDSLQISLCTGGPDLEQAIADFVAVSLQSWKMPVSMVAPHTLNLIRLAAAKDCLRLGILKIEGEPVAAQFWIVAGATALCARLAYHENYGKLAVGVVLTSYMVAQLLDRDHVGKIDFGLGEENYKAGWMRDVRQYYGFMAFNPVTLRGLLQGVRHIVGQWIKRLVVRSLEVLHLRRPRAAPDEGEEAV